MTKGLSPFTASAIILLSVVGPACAQAVGPGVAPAAVSSGVPIAAPTRPLSLTDAVSMAVGNNSGIIAARQRLQKAQELIAQVNAQGRPQIAANAIDVYSSFSAYPPVLSTPSLANPVLPGGGAIPQVVDAAANFSGAFIGASVVGAAPAGGAVSPGLAGPAVGGGTTSSMPITPATTGGAATGPASTGGAPVTPTIPPTGTATTPGSTPPATNSPAGSGTAPGTVTPGTAPGSAPPAANSPGASSPAPATPGAGSPAPGGNGGAGAAPGGNGAAPGGNGGAGAAPGAGTVPAPGANGGAGAGAAGGAGASNALNAPLTAVALLPAIIDGYVTQTRNLASGAQPVSFAPELAAAQTAAGQGRISPEAQDAVAKSGPEQAASGAELRPAQTPSVSSGTSPAENPQSNNYLARVDIAQFLDVFGLLGTERSAQKSVRDFYSYDVTRLQNETALAAKNLFFNVLLAQAEVDTEQEQVNYAQEDVRITQDRFTQGLVSNFDVLTAQTALSTAQQELIAADDQRDLAQASLSYLLGTNPNQALALAGPTLPPLNEAVDLPRSTAIAIANRPEMLQAAADIREAQKLVTVAASGLWPTLGVVGSAYGTSEASIDTPQNYAEIALELSVPIDDGGLTRSRVRSAKVDVQAQQLALLQTQASVSLEVRQAIVNIRNAQAQVASASTGVAQAEEALRLARERYGAGLGMFLDVLNALAQLAATRINLSNAQFFYQSSLAQFVRAMGGR